MRIKKLLSIGMVSMAFLVMGCSHDNNQQGALSGEITVVSRETGSGTRDAFIEQVGLLEKDENHKIDQTTLEAIVQNSTAGVLSTVAGLDQAIGYVSLGTLSDLVQPVAINGVLPSTQTILAGDYSLQRPFMICWPNEVREVVSDFISFMNSNEGQAIVEQAGYVPTSQNDFDYQVGKEQQGLITVVGSTSVTPVMEQLAERYQQLQTNVQIDIISNGSTAGITAIEEGTADIGMSSRPLKPLEASQMNAQAIALDGIVVVINHENPLHNLSLQEVRDIFKGDITDWQELANN